MKDLHKYNGLHRNNRLLIWNIVFVWNIFGSNIVGSFDEF